jgi:hypothetical protein
MIFIAFFFKPFLSKMRDLDMPLEKDLAVLTLVFF